MLINTVLNQGTYPGAGDLDDCWVVSLVQAASASDPSIDRPTVTEFRAAAGDPDDGYRDGGNPSEWKKAVTTLWPDIGAFFAFGIDWASFEGYLKRGWIASLAISSLYLPPSLQYGFTGLHQVTLFMDAGYFHIANPLQPDGSAPQLVGGKTIRNAAHAYGNGFVYAVLFPPPARENASMYKFDIIEQRIGSVTTKKDGVPRAAIQFEDGQYFFMEPGSPKDVLAKIRVSPRVPGGKDDTRDRETAFLIGTEGAFFLAIDVDDHSETVPQRDNRISTTLKRLAIQAATDIEIIAQRLRA